ncbi:MAG: PepSY domain-containing protein, partial [Clostridia bacterium]|nr:PepSY domain-containing protein [Clostridia bacterium]
MKRTILFFLAALLLFSACGRQTLTVPDAPETPATVASPSGKTVVAPAATAAPSAEATGTTAAETTAAPTTEPTGVTVQAKGPASDATLLDEATVKALVLSHAELTEAAVQYWRAKLDRENGRLVYEAELTADGVEFEYEVDAMTGEIVKCEREQLAANPVPAEEPIGEEKAKEIALQHAGVSTADAEQLRV